MFKANQKSTIYGDWVRDGVGQYLDKVRDAFTLKEFANYWGIPLTHNLRKRIKSMVYDGTLNCHYALAGDRGSVIVYTRPISEPQYSGDPLCPQ